MRIISLSNHKGGVGKTTSTLNIGSGLNKLGKKVLLIDLDAQANLSVSLNIIENNNNIYRAIKGETKIEPIEIKKDLHLIPSTLDLSGAEIELSGEAGREYILKDLIAPFKNKYDFILIDCPPSLGLLTINSFTASSEIIIPLQAEFLALQGLTKLIEVIDKIKKRLNKNLKISGVLITQFDKRRILNRDIQSTLKKHFKEVLFKTTIQENISIAEAPSRGLDIFDYAPKSKGANDYFNVCKEIIKTKPI